eukprot:scaffold285_cov330-Pavlova_lutheri.AAC.122
MAKMGVVAALYAALSAAVGGEAEMALSPTHQKVVDELSVVLDSYQRGEVRPADEWAAFRVVQDLVEEAEDLEGVEVIDCGGKHQPYPRNLPKTMDPNVLADFHQSFSLMQDIGQSEEDLNVYDDGSSQFVATIEDGYVQGDAGLVFDEQGRLYQEKNHFFSRSGEPSPRPVLEALDVERDGKVVQYDALATTIQKYGYMYYHFVEETLPKLVLLKQSGLLDKYPDMKILMWGQPYEASYLDLLEIQGDRVVIYEPHQTYHADVLAFPTPSARITPAKESLELVRQALGADQIVPQEERSKIIYCSRSGESSRKVVNEDEIIQAIKDEFPEDEVVVYTSISDAREVIDLFKHAKLVVGPHGAGLSHILFAAPGTPVVEFLFMQDPPMMFWHTSASIDLDYWMVPVPQSDWMGSVMEVPIQEVEDVLHAIKTGAVDLPTCQPGTAMQQNGDCVPCSAGTYAFSMDAPICKQCFQGQVAEGEGSTACRTCPPNTYAAEGKSCVPCPDGTTSPLPGAYKKEQCVPSSTARGHGLTKSMEIFRKLSPGITGVRGRMAQEVDEMLNSPEFTSAAACQLIRAIAGSMSGDYLYSTTASLEECESLEDIRREEALAAAIEDGIEETMEEEDMLEDMEAPAPEPESLGTASEPDTTLIEEDMLEDMEAPGPEPESLENASEPDTTPIEEDMLEDMEAPVPEPESLDSAFGPETTPEEESSFWEEEYIVGGVVIPRVDEPAPAPEDEDEFEVADGGDIPEDDDVVLNEEVEVLAPAPEEEFIEEEEDQIPAPEFEDEEIEEDQVPALAPEEEEWYSPAPEHEGEEPGYDVPEVESTEVDISPVDHRTFVSDETCPTGVAYQVPDVVRASSGGEDTRCIECEQRILASIQACQSLSDDEACCDAAAAWNNGGCYCVQDSAERAEEAGATLHFMDLIAPLCGFERISPEDQNCPETFSAPSEEGDNGSGITRPSYLVVALGGALAILLGTAASYT